MRQALAEQYQQRVCGPIATRLELVPPLTKEFDVCGGSDIVERARQWALENRFLLVRGVPICAHGFYLLDMCPREACRKMVRDLDHEDLWVPDVWPGERIDTPFLLSHPYTKNIDDSTKAYAMAHGLNIHVNEVLDSWYGPGTLPIRMTIPDSWPLWPIESEAIVLLRTLPVRWPTVSDVSEPRIPATDEEILSALKIWRYAEAQKHKKPAYFIFNDDTLKAVSTIKPLSEIELSGIRGFGSRKLETYGQAVLKIVRTQVLKEK